MWVRYNPNAWHVDGVTTRVPKEQREQRLFDYERLRRPELGEAQHLDRATLSESVGLQAVQYWYYDQDDGQLEVSSKAALGGAKLDRVPSRIRKTCRQRDH